MMAIVILLTPSSVAILSIESTKGLVNTKITTPPASSKAMLLRSPLEDSLATAFSRANFAAPLATWTT